MFRYLTSILTCIAIVCAFSQNEAIEVKWSEPFPVAKRTGAPTILTNATTIVNIETIIKGIEPKFEHKSFRLIDKKTMKTTFTQSFTKQITHYYKALYLDNILTEENLYLFGKMKKAGQYEYFVLIYDMQGKLVGNKPICTYKKKLNDKFRFIEGLDRFHLHIGTLFTSKYISDIYFDKDFKVLNRNDQKVGFVMEQMSFETISEDFKRCRFVKKHSPGNPEYVLEIIDDKDPAKASKIIALPFKYYHVSQDIDFTFSGNTIALTAFYRADYSGGNIDGIFYFEYDLNRDKVVVHKEKLLDSKNFGKYMVNYTGSKTASIRYLQAIRNGDEMFLVFEHVDAFGFLAQNMIVMALRNYVELDKVNYLAKYTSAAINMYEIPYLGSESIAGFMYKGKPAFLYNDLANNAKTNNPEKIEKALLYEAATYGLVFAIMDQDEVKKKLLFENTEVKVVALPNYPAHKSLDVTDLVFRAVPIEKKKGFYKIGMLSAP